MLSKKFFHQSLPIRFINQSAVLIMIFLGCSGNEWAQRIDWPEIDMQELPTGEEYPGESAVILLDEGSIELHTLSETAFSIYDRHTIVKILNSRGFKYANIAVPYGANSEVDEIEARTIGPGNKITVLNPEKIYDVNLYPNFVFYSDQRAKIFTLPAVTEGSIIEYRYQVILNSRTYGSQWRFQSEIPVLKSRFKLVKQSEWKIDYRIHGNVSEPTILNLPAGFKQSMIWEAGPLPALKSESFMPPLSETGTRLTIAPFGISTWSDLSQWYYNLVRSSMDQRKDLSELADSLCANLDTDRDRLQAIFQWIRDEVRYIAVEIGIGGYQPSPAEDVLYERYGDCKDMTTLLCALAEEIDIPVYQALISTRQNGLPDTTLPAATQFNHVIAYAPTLGPEGLWMDATDKSCAFGALPWYDQNVPVLLIGEEGEGRLMHTPASIPEDNLSDMNWEVALQADGSAHIIAHMSYEGITANEIRHQLRVLSPSDQKEWLEILMEERSPGSQVDSFEIKHLWEPHHPLRINFNFYSDRFAQVIPGMVVIRPGKMINEKLHTYFHNITRSHPVRLQIPAARKFTIVISLPENWRPEIESDSLSQDDSFGRYILAWETKKNRLYISYAEILPAQDISVSSYHKFLRHLDSIRKLLDVSVILVPADQKEKLKS